MCSATHQLDLKCRQKCYSVIVRLEPDFCADNTFFAVFPMNIIKILCDVVGTRRGWGLYPQPFHLSREMPCGIS